MLDWRTTSQADKERSRGKLLLAKLQFTQRMCDATASSSALTADCTEGLATLKLPSVAPSVTIFDSQKKYYLYKAVAEVSWKPCYLLKEKKKENNSKDTVKRAPLKLNSAYFFSACAYIKNREPCSKVPKSCAATEPLLAQTCHGFWSMLRSCCQSSNNSHHLLSCFSRHFANICQLDGFFSNCFVSQLGCYIPDHGT